LTSVEPAGESNVCLIGNPDLGRMRRTRRQVLAVMLVATALCADRGLAAPSARPQAITPAGSRAGRLIDRLSRGLSRTVAVARPCQDRRPERLILTHPATPVDRQPYAAHRPVSPFQFRLPPPLA
jgi:hypothetical protein